MSFLNNEPRGGKATQWLGGVVAPSPLAFYGVSCIVNRAGAFPGKGENIAFAGVDAVVLGIACLCAALLLHFHFFWGLSENEAMKENYEYGKFAALFGLIPSFAWVTWCLLRGFGELY